MLLACGPLLLAYELSLTLRCTDPAELAACNILAKKFWRFAGTVMLKRECVIPPTSPGTPSKLDQHRSRTHAIKRRRPQKKKTQTNLLPRAHITIGARTRGRSGQRPYGGPGLGRVVGVGPVRNGTGLGHGTQIGPAHGRMTM